MVWVRFRLEFWGLDIGGGILEPLLDFDWAVIFEVLWEVLFDFTVDFLLFFKIDFLLFWTDVLLPSSSMTSVNLTSFSLLLLLFSIILSALSINPSPLSSSKSTSSLSTLSLSKISILLAGFFLLREFWGSGVLLKNSEMPLSPFFFLSPLICLLGVIPLSIKNFYILKCLPLALSSLGCFPSRIII